jgi:[ribosomal protein S5]-alanine N-acetyltransferase
MTAKTTRLTDGVVIIRKFTLSDRIRMAEIANNEKISNNLRNAFPHPYSLSDADEFIESCIHQDPVEVFAIEYEGLYVGNIGLNKMGDVYGKSAELGYFIGEPYWNKGITTRAVKLICEYGFSELDIVRIFSGVFDYNLASRRVLEKCGFTRESVAKYAVFKNGKICDEVRYAKIISK